MKKEIHFILSVFLVVFCILTVLLSYLYSVLLLYNILIVFTFCITLAVLVSKSKKLQKLSKTVIVALLNICLISYVGFLMFFGCRNFYIYNGEEAIYEFEEIKLSRISDENTFNPFENIGLSYEKAEFYKYRLNGLWLDHSGTLFLTYSDEDFIEAKRSIESQYDFYERLPFNEALSGEFEFDGFNFRFVDINSSTIEYPDVQYYDLFHYYAYLVGVNDSNNQIVYMITYNDGLVSISDYDSYMFLDCGWDYIERSRDNYLFRLFYKE